MTQQALNERFFETLVSGEREAARRIVHERFEAGDTPEALLEHLFYPTLEMIQKLYRNDQMSTLAHHFATRLLRMLADQMQERLTRGDRHGKKVLLLCGPNEPDELAGQMAADLLEADGYGIYFPGGGVANDEIISQVGELQPDALVLFGSTPSDLPYIRHLIDHLHDVGVCPSMQIVVGGGVFNRADGLAQEIGADLWARTPSKLKEIMQEKPEHRRPSDQRTVGRRRRGASKTAGAA